MELSADAWTKIESGRKVIDDLLKTKQPVYGVNTGYV